MGKVRVYLMYSSSIHVNACTHMYIHIGIDILHCKSLISQTRNTQLNSLFLKS